VFGVQSDPVKTANFRAASRVRAACLVDPHCPSNTAAFFNFSRLLVKVPEHTWGEGAGHGEGVAGGWQGQSEVDEDSSL